MKKFHISFPSPEKINTGCASINVVSDIISVVAVRFVVMIVIHKGIRDCCGLV